MPVSEISGVTMGPSAVSNPLQDFAEHLQRAQAIKRQEDANKRQEAGQRFQMMMKMVNDSGGRITFDPKEVDKVAKEAGFPGGMLTSGVTGIAEAARARDKQATDLFQQQMKESQARQAASTTETDWNKEKLQHEQFINQLDKQIADPKTPKEQVPGLMAQRAFIANPSPDTTAMADLAHSDPKAFETQLEAVRAHARGDLTKGQLHEKAVELGEHYAQYFDNDLKKGIEYAEAQLKGEKTDLIPKTPKGVEMQMKVLQTQLDTEIMRAKTAFIEAGTAATRAKFAADDAPVERMLRLSQSIKDLAQADKAAGNVSGMNLDAANKAAELLQRIEKLPGGGMFGIDPRTELLEQARFELQMAMGRGVDTSMTGAAKRPGVGDTDPAAMARGLAEFRAGQQGALKPGTTVKLGPPSPDQNDPNQLLQQMLDQLKR